MVFHKALRCLIPMLLVRASTSFQTFTGGQQFAVRGRAVAMHSASSLRSARRPSHGMMPLGHRPRTLVSMAVATSNPLLDQEALPKFSQIQPSHVKPAITQLVKQFEADLVDLEQQLISGEVSGWSVVEALERLRAPMEYGWGVVGHLNGVKNSDDLRDAYTDMQPVVIQAFTKLGQSKAIFEAFKALQEGSLQPVQQRIVDAAVTEMSLSGVGLEGEDKLRFNNIQLRLAEMSTQFGNNLLDATKQFHVDLTTKAQVDGFPQSLLALTSQTAASSGVASSAAEGPWRVTLDMPCFLPVMQHATDRALREQMYKAHVTRASEAELDNSPLVGEILSLKTEMAVLLGYPTYADMSLATKMAGSVQEVEQLLGELREVSFPAAQRELSTLQGFAEGEGGFEGTLELWDTPFYAERQREQLFDFTEEQLRPYFPLPNVLKGLFEVTEQLFGVSVEEADGATDVWHPSVQFFHINDQASGAHIASFFLDPYSRPEEKRGGAWMDTCVGRSGVLGRLPVAYLTCNGSPPVGDVPSLMSYNEVTTLFHEFGHGLQHMLTEVDLADAAGINLVEWDAVELPSQFMENWCFDEHTVLNGRFAVHHETGETLPRTLFEKVSAARKHNAGMMMLRQLYFSQLDLSLYSHFPQQAALGVSPFEMQQQMAPDFTVQPPLPQDRFLCGFSHIFAGGYSAGYYSYKWAEVMSADAFAAFEEVGLNDAAAVAEVGRRFRDTVLSQGGGSHPMELYTQFRGRGPTTAALLQHSGLTPATAK